MDYGDAQCVNMPGLPGAVAAKQAAQCNASILGAGAAMQETELSSLLSTLEQQAYEVRGITASVLNRVSPQCENECAEKQVFGSGYVGRAESIRSTLSETIRLLGTMSKLV